MLWLPDCGNTAGLAAAAVVGDVGVGVVEEEAESSVGHTVVNVARVDLSEKGLGA